jgi:hypothetical protein
MDTDLRIEDLGTEVDLRFLIAHREAPREQEMTIIWIEVEILEDSRFITKMLPKTILAALEFLTKT